MPAADDAVVGRDGGVGVLEHVLELADLALELALLLAGGVVAAVLAEVALVARGADPADDALAPGTLHVLQLRGSSSNAFWVSQMGPCCSVC